MARADVEVILRYWFTGYDPVSWRSIAQRERELIGQYTRDTLAVTRKPPAQQGHTLGNPNGAAALRRSASRRGCS